LSANLGPLLVNFWPDFEANFEQILGQIYDQFWTKLEANFWPILDQFFGQLSAIFNKFLFDFVPIMETKFGPIF
jgi:hypothetical protein